MLQRSLVIIRSTEQEHRQLAIDLQYCNDENTQIGIVSTLSGRFSVDEI